MLPILGLALIFIVLPILGRKPRWWRTFSGSGWIDGGGGGEGGDFGGGGGDFGGGGGDFGGGGASGDW